jgi:hypothetical protein
MLLLVLVVSLFNPATVLSQSSVIAFPRNTAPAATVSNIAVPNSISSAQTETETMLSRPVETISIRQDETLSASNVFELLPATTFVHSYLDGVLDEKTNLNMKASVSIYASLKNALELNDASILVSSDGSILIFSIDDENEPHFLQTVSYDVTSITGSFKQAEELEFSLYNVIAPDSWELNGGGNASLSIYHQNERILMTIRQSYKVHLDIRSHFDSLVRLGGSSIVSTAPVRTRRSASSAPSSIVALPVKQTTSALRSRRGFARPNSGTSGGMGGGGAKAGSFF